MRLIKIVYDILMIGLSVASLVVAILTYRNKK